MGYKTDDKSEPYGVCKNGKVRRRPGPKPGAEKIPGSGGKAVPIEMKLDEASDALALQVISGEPILQHGATGKSFTAPAALSIRQRFASEWWNRRRPTLTATAVKADITTEHVNAEPSDPRQVARAVLSVLEHAKLAEQAEHPIAEHVDPRRYSAPQTEWMTPAGRYSIR